MSGNLRKRISRIERLLTPVHQAPLEFEEIERRLLEGRDRAEKDTLASRLAELEEQQKQDPTPERAQEILRLQEERGQELEQARQRAQSLREQIEARERVRRAWRGRR